MIIPITLMKHFNWEMSELWKVYLPAMILGILLWHLPAIIAEKKGKFREILLYWNYSFWSFISTY